MGKVKVDKAAIARYASRVGDLNITVPLVIASPEGFRDLPAVSLATSTCNVAARTAADEDARLSVGSRPFDTTHGSVAFVSAPTPAALMWWVERLATELEDQGFEGSVAVAPSDENPLTGDNPAPIALTAVLCVAGWVTARRARGKSVAVAPWSTDVDVANRFSAWASAWTAAAGGDGFLRQGRISTAVTGPLALPAAVLRPERQNVQLIGYKDHENIRVVSFEHSGRVVVQLRSLDMDWLEKLRALQLVAEHFAGELEAALVRWAMMPAVDTAAVVTTLPPRLTVKSDHLSPSSYLRTSRNLDAVYATDACGAQLLSSTHLARARDLSRWKHRPLSDSELTWVEAADLQVWFEHSDVPERVVERARHDFGPLLLTEAPRG